MRSGAVIIFFVFIIAACKDENRIPRSVLSQEKMQLVLWDMMRADQFLAEFVFKNDSTLNKRIESTKMYQDVLAIHGISQEKFSESFRFYQSHPALLKILMDSLNKKPIAIPKNDSLIPALIEDTIKSKPVIDTGRRSQMDSLTRRKIRDTSRRAIKSIRGL
jgi:hypothetical protein